MTTNYFFFLSKFPRKVPFVASSNIPLVIMHVLSRNEFIKYLLIYSFVSSDLVKQGVYYEINMHKNVFHTN